MTPRGIVIPVIDKPLLGDDNRYVKHRLLGAALGLNFDPINEL